MCVALEKGDTLKQGFKSEKNSMIKCAINREVFNQLPSRNIARTVSSELLGVCF